MADEESVRDRILATVRSFPGIHLRGIVRHINTSTALARYHLDALLEENIVREYEVGGFVRYFPAETFKELSEPDKQMLHVLRQERPLEIVLAFLEMGPMQHRELLEVVGGSKGTLSYQLDKLIEAGVVEKVAKGPERGFSIKHPEKVRELLGRYEPVPDVLQEVASTWDDLFSGHRRAPKP